ncbi:hypothetical protein Pmani_033591, partial [Petrolisthes manimaculis]
PYKYRPRNKTTTTTTTTTTTSSSSSSSDLLDGDNSRVTLEAGDTNRVYENTYTRNEYRPSTNNNNYNNHNHDPDAIRMSTKSAIMAASILGGVTMCVFLAILVVVMYKGRARFRRRRRRIPLSLPSDASTSSTPPPLYSQRMLRGPSVGKGGAYQTAGFWGTLKKRFDPYSLSPTPTVMS